jgi:broad specificity phosphatase PhoE
VKSIFISSLFIQAKAMSTQSKIKIIRFLRHGQAMHNINAERLKAEGCSHDVFLRAMEIDDAHDAPLTDLGKSQARSAAQLESFKSAKETVDLVVSSPLSRALDTADLCFPAQDTPLSRGRLCLENIREINGWLVNAKRKPRSELCDAYGGWDFADLVDEDDTMWASWGNRLEDDESTRRRAYESMMWLWSRAEQDIALVAHGGIFSLLTNGHPLVDATPAAGARFLNCELRSCVLACDDDGSPAPRFRLCLIDEFH